MLKRRNQGAGFTLIELMISVAIVAIIALAAQGWFFTAMCYTITGVFVYSLRTKYIAEAKAEEAKNEADRKS